MSTRFPEPGLLRYTLLPVVIMSYASNAHADERVLRKETTVDATRAEVWATWTTVDGVKSFFAPDADIELKLGGKYEIYFMPDAPAGDRGADGCTVLSYLAPEMLAFTWNAPPSIPELRAAQARTQVVLRFDELEPGKTRVRLTQHGFSEGEDWDLYYTYFDNAWGKVLTWLKDRFASDKPRPPVPLTKPTRKSWTDGHVRVTATTGPTKRQDFELELPLPIADVWRALATTEGLKSLMGTDALVELKPGGTYREWPGADNRVLAFIPQEMLSGTGSAPPEFPAVRAGGTWWIYWFDKIDDEHTRLRMSLVGWQQGAEWDKAFDYFLKNNAAYLNHVYEKLTTCTSSRPKPVSE